jgi:CxxC-x17-CxxC domain-containing protein
MGNYNQNNRSGGGRGGNRFGGGNYGPRRFGGRDSRDGGRPTMFQTVCDNCGKDCEVPFKPTGDKPVFCSDCFATKRGDSGNRRPEGRRFGGNDFDDRADRQMFSATCDNCGEECQVPFRPTAGKPVYCNNCFDTIGGREEGRNKRASGSVDNSAQVMEQIKELNAKLDRILKVLDPAVKQKSLNTPLPFGKKKEVTPEAAVAVAVVKPQEVVKKAVKQAVPVTEVKAKKTAKKTVTKKVTKKKTGK